MTYHFDMDKFWLKLKHLSLGTGTLAANAGVPPDAVQRLIATEEAEQEVGDKILGVLTRDVLAYDPDDASDDTSDDAQEPNEPMSATIADVTINEIKQAVADGEMTLEDVLNEEPLTAAPRSTLINWANDEIVRNRSNDTGDE